MPALQVRDFPDELYERLKLYAAGQHRSMAQQTIVAVEQMLLHVDAPYGQGGEQFRQTLRMCSFDGDTEEMRTARIKKRKKLFAHMERVNWNGPMPTAEDIVATIREGHEGRDRGILESVGFCDIAKPGKENSL